MKRSETRFNRSETILLCIFVIEGETAARVGELRRHLIKRLLQEFICIKKGNLILNMALKATTCKEAIVAWEQAKGQKAEEAEVVEFQFRWPPIEKMDGSLSTLTACRKLSLSSNMIDKIAGIAGMRNLKILSLGRNYIKSLAGIETVADTLEELWISYNLIEKLKGIGSLKNLKVFYISNNVIKEWVEFNRLQDCTKLRDLVFVGNPLVDALPDVDTWRTQATNRLLQITKLDGIPVVRL